MGTVTPLRRQAAPQLDPENLAIGRLWQRQQWPRHEAVEDCIDYLCDSYQHTERSAENAAVQALAELEGVNSRATIDIAATTSHVVVLTNRAGQRIALSVRDLHRLLEGQDLQCGNSTTGRLLLLEH